MNLAGLFSRELAQRFAAELLGSALLLAVVVGSGIMGERLAGGNAAIALLANSVATGVALFVLISTFAPISGAHLNPVVTMIEAWSWRLPRKFAPFYLVAQFAGAILGVFAAHIMFELPLVYPSQHIRSGGAQWFSEFIATFGLIFIILQGSKSTVAQVAAMVACYITAAYWFTSSTSFANPAVTFARALTDTFAGIRMVDVPAFMVAQTLGAVAAYTFYRWLNRGR